ncbi:ComEC/Rec2 family competence protein [Verrucomicrobiota bacterium]
MTALRIVWLSLGFVLGIVLATVCRCPAEPWVLLPLGAAGAVLTLFLHATERRMWKTWSPVTVVCAALLCAVPTGCWRTMQKVGPAPPGSLRCLLAALGDKTPLVLEGTVAKEPELRLDGKGDLRISVDRIIVGDATQWTSVTPGKVLVRTYVPGRSSGDGVARLNSLMDNRTYGYRLEVETKYRAPRPLLNPGEFDQAAFLLQNDLVARFTCPVGNVSVVEESEGHPMTELALLAKRRFLSTYRETIRGPASRLVAAATLGTRRALEKKTFAGKEITETFRHAGVGHVLAVSGLHVSIVALLLYAMLRMTGLRPRVFAPVLILFLVIFALLTGARPSSVRAVIMNSVILVAFAYFRCGLREATAIGLALSSLVILLVNPIVLYAPGFLLSFGAVLSLVLIAPPMERWLFAMRGFSLLFVLSWFALLIVTAAAAPSLFLRPANTLGAAGLLWLLVGLGGRLNDMFPLFWKAGMEKVPRPLRMFLCAQIAIQAGMMLPLSAWFFGRFPVAGVLVNLAAIPAVGVLVQLGMLTGLAGLIPAAGGYLAMPLGAAATLVGEIFFRLAHGGASLFPYPAVPKPSVTWMALYYAGVGAVLVIDASSVRLKALAYRLWPAFERHRRLAAAVYLVPAMLVLYPLVFRPPTRPSVRTAVCFASRSYPVLALVSERHTAVLLNAGDGYTGSRIVFEGVRKLGGMSVETAVMCGPQPDAGNEGLAELIDKMSVGECYLAVTTGPHETYLDAVGDSYVRNQAAAGRSWATRYESAYNGLVEAMAARGVSSAPLKPGTVAEWADTRVRVLPPPASLPARFVTSARSAICEVDLRGFRWLVITDSLPEVVRETVPRDAAPWDVLVLPDTTSRRYYRRLIDEAVAAAQPRAVIVCGNTPRKGFDAKQWAQGHGKFQLLSTARDGAVLCTFTPEGALRLTGFHSGRTVELTAP